MIRLLAPLAIFSSLGLAAEQASQEAGTFAQVPLASVQQPQQYFQQAFPAAQQQQFVQYQPQQQQFYYPQQQAQVQQQQQAFYYPYQAYQQQVQYAPVQPAFQMSPKLTIPTGLLRKHLNASSDEPSVFAMSYNPETGVKVATINGKKVFAYKQRFPGAPKEDVEIVENGEIDASGTPTVVASTTENEAGEKTKNVFFDDRDDPMVKIEKEAVATTVIPSTTVATVVNSNLPVVNQDGDEATTVASNVVTTTVSPTTTVASGITAGPVVVTPVPVVGGETVVSTTAVPAVAIGAVSTTTALPVTVGAEAVVTSTAAPVVSTTTPTIPSYAFFAAQNPQYMANVAAFSARYPQYFPTRFAAPGKPFPVPFTAAPQQQQAQYAAFPTTVAPAAFGAAAGLQIGSGLSQVHPVYAQSAVSTTPFPQAAAQYIARPVPVAFAHPRPVYVPQPTAVPQAQYFQSTAVPVAAPQQFAAPLPQQYLQPVQQQQAQVAPQQYLQQTTAQPLPQQYLQPVQQQQQAQYVPQQQQQQYLQPTNTQAASQYQPQTAPQTYYPQTQPTPVPQQPQQPQYVPQQPVRQHSQYQQPRYPAPAAPTRHQYAQHPAPPTTPAYHDVQRPAPPQDFTDDELRKPDDNESEPVDHNSPATSTMPPGMRPDDRYHAPTHYQQANGYSTPEPEAETERPSSPPRYRPAPSTPSRYVERPAETERYPEIVQPTSTPGYDEPETTTYAPRPAPSRRPYAPQRPTSSYVARPAAYRQPAYRRPAPPPRRYNPAPAPARYNPNRKVTYYAAGTNRRVQEQPAYNRNSNGYAAPRAEDSATTQSSITDYVPSPAYKQHTNGGYARPQPQYTAHAAAPQYASQNAYSRTSAYAPAETTTTEAPAEGERYYARVNNDDQSKVKFSENPFDNMEFQSTPFPAGHKKDVKVTFINRHRSA